eukprot:6191145-Pleurochrysis_carterae.AAC.1
MTLPLSTSCYRCQTYEHTRIRLEVHFAGLQSPPKNTYTPVRAQNGESNWMMGVMLVVCYCSVAAGFFVHVDPPEA